MKTPERVGPYAVVRELGRGGMGVVYEVREPGTDRPLALKLVLPGAADHSGALERFEREAQLMAKVAHPGVVKVHAFARTEQGEPYFVTDLVAGTSLRRLRLERPMPARRVAEIVRDLASAVEAVHARGILHRDLKPENVIVRDDGTPVVLDFGLAREGTASALTKTGELLGTFAYMAPEQAEGMSPSQLDTRLDVYALGAILFFLLAGRAPFDGPPAQVIAQVLLKAPAWPTAGDDVPPALLAICRRAMAKRRDDRFPDAAALRAELERWLEGPPAARRPWRAALALGLLLVAGLGVAIAGRRSDAPPPPGPQATASPPPPAATPPPERATTKPRSVGAYREALATRTTAGHPAFERSLGTFGGPLARLALKPSIEGTDEPGTSVRFLDDTHVVTRYRMREDLHVWDLSEPTPGDTVLCNAPRGTSELWMALAVSGPPGRREVYFASGDRDVSRVAWPGGAPERVATVPGEAHATGNDTRVVALAVSVDPASGVASKLAVGGYWKEACVFDLRKPPGPPVLLPGHAYDVVGVAFSPDGRTLVTANKLSETAQVLHVFDTVSGNETATVFAEDGKEVDLTGIGGKVRDVAFRPGTSTFAHVGTGDGLPLDSLDKAASPVTTSRARVGEQSPGDVETRAVRFYRERAFTLLADRKGTRVTVWDLTGKRLPRDFAVGHVDAKESALSMDVSPDGNLLAVATQNDGSVEIFGAYAPEDFPP